MDWAGDFARRHSVRVSRRRVAGCWRYRRRGAVCAYHPGTGQELWRVRYGNGYSVVPRPVLAHGLLFLGTGYDRPSFYAVKPGGRGDLTDSNIAWQTARGAPNTPSALVVGDERMA